jgi:hypothetical protein
VVAQDNSQVRCSQWGPRLVPSARAISTSQKFVKGCHMWPIHDTTYAMCVRFSLSGCASIQIVRTLLDIGARLSLRVTT